MIERALYMEIIGFLTEQYGSVHDWECRRVLMSLDAGLYFLEREPGGGICTYVGWWLIQPEQVERIANEKLSVEEAISMEISTGNTVWIMDAASTKPGSIPNFRRYMRQRYPSLSGIQGVAWLRLNKNKKLISKRQKGV